MNGPRWDEERDVELRRMWEENALTFSEIAAELGVTRNAAIGRAHRLGLKKTSYAPKSPKPQIAKPAHVIAKKTFFPKSKPKEKLRMVIDTSEPLPESLMVELWQVQSNQCRFPYGEPSDVDSFRFCGAPKADDSAYCATHHGLCHAASTPRLGVPRPDATFMNRKRLGTMVAMNGLLKAEQHEAA